MCGRYTLTTELADWTEYSGYSVPETGYGPRYNIAPGQYAPVVVNGDGGGVTRIMKWGLVPFWAKDEKIAYKTINARSETLDERASFKHALKKRRCLVPADGFYEWQKTAGGKVPHYIYLKDRRAFAFAGLWEKWEKADAPDGEPGTPANPLYTFTIITTTPNSFMEPIHNRMPVILDPADEARWLDPDSDPLELARLFLPYAAEAMDAHPVDPDVGSVKHDRPDLIEPSGQLSL